MCSIIKKSDKSILRELDKNTVKSVWRNISIIMVHNKLSLAEHVGAGRIGPTSSFTQYFYCISEGSYLWYKSKGPSVANKKQISGDLTTQYWKNLFWDPVLFLY